MWKRANGKHLEKEKAPLKRENVVYSNQTNRVFVWSISTFQWNPACKLHLLSPLSMVIGLITDCSFLGSPQRIFNLTHLKKKS